MMPMEFVDILLQNGAMGLFAAIPAVIAYNRFSAGAESLIARYDVFVEEFASIVNRQAVSGRRRG